MKQSSEMKTWHINVVLMFIHQFFDRINYSMKNAFLQDHYIFLKFKKNKTVGLLSIINSCVCLIMSPCVGFFCDNYKHKRKVLLQFTTISYLLINVIYYTFVRTNKLSVVICITALSKMLHECCHIITESIFIESIERGKKSLIFTYQKLISTVATMLGPFFCLLLFYIYNDIWDIKNLFVIFQVAILSIVPQAVISFLWVNEIDVENPKKKEDLEIVKNEEKRNRKVGIFKTEHIPYIVFFSHIITLAGAGMTVKYFSLFLKTEYKVSPMTMCSINILIPIFMLIFTYTAQRLSRTIGRAQVSFFFTTIGVMLLCYLPYLHNYKYVLKVHIFRTVFQNCSHAIDKSILYDYIDTKKETGKWMGVQSLNYLVWSLSAYFGGWLSDITCYRNTFKITSCFYIVSLLLYTPLLWLVPVKESV